MAAKAITVIWSPKAMDLIADLHDFLVQFLGQAKSDEYVDDLFDFVDEKLNPNPERFPPCRNKALQNAGCRCLVFRKKYVVVYEVVNDLEVNVLGVIHSNRSPKEFAELLKSK